MTAFRADEAPFYVSNNASPATRDTLDALRQQPPFGGLVMTSLKARLDRLQERSILRCTTKSGHIRFCNLPYLFDRVADKAANSIKFSYLVSDINLKHHRTDPNCRDNCSLRNNPDK